MSYTRMNYGTLEFSLDQTRAYNLQHSAHGNYVHAPVRGHIQLLGAATSPGQADINTRRLAVETPQSPRRRGNHQSPPGPVHAHAGERPGRRPHHLLRPSQCFCFNQTVWRPLRFGLPSSLPPLSLCGSASAPPDAALLDLRVLS